MPNTVPASAEGLPNSDLASCLVETDRGLAISRLKTGMRPSMLAGEALDAFLAKLDELVSAKQREEELLFGGNDFANPERDELRERVKALRRSMVVPIRTIRTAKSRTIEDMLFKAEISEIIEPYECRRSEFDRTLSRQ